MKKIVVAIVLVLASCSKESPVQSKDIVTEQIRGGDAGFNLVRAEYVDAANILIWDRYRTDRSALTYEDHRLVIASELHVQGVITSEGPTYVYGLDGKRYAFDGRNWIEH